MASGPWKSFGVGTLLEVTCRACGTVSNQTDGPIFAGYNPRCVQCGATKLVSIERLRRTDSPDLDPEGKGVWALREERIPELAGRCECGGAFSLDAPIRCPSCRSTDVKAVTEALVD